MPLCADNQRIPRRCAWPVSCCVACCLRGALYDRCGRRSSSSSRASCQCRNSSTRASSNSSPRDSTNDYPKLCCRLAAVARAHLTLSWACCMHCQASATRQYDIQEQSALAAQAEFAEARARWQERLQLQDQCIEENTMLRKELARVRDSLTGNLHNYPAAALLSQSGSGLLSFTLPPLPHLLHASPPFSQCLHVRMPLCAIPYPNQDSKGCARRIHSSAMCDYVARVAVGSEQVRERGGSESKRRRTAQPTTRVARPIATSSRRSCCRLVSRSACMLLLARRKALTCLDRPIPEPEALSSPPTHVCSALGFRVQDWPWAPALSTSEAQGTRPLVHRGCCAHARCSLPGRRSKTCRTQAPLPMSLRTPGSAAAVRCSSPEQGSLHARDTAAHCSCARG